MNTLNEGLNKFAKPTADTELLKSLATTEFSVNGSLSEELSKALEESNVVHVTTTVHGKHGDYQNDLFKSQSELTDDDAVIEKKPES